MTVNQGGALPRTPGMLQGVVLLLPISLVVMGIVALVPVVPQLIRQFGGTPHGQYLVMGGVLTLPALCVAIFAPVAGWAADKVGRRTLLIVSMILYAFLGAAPCVLDGLPAIIASRAGVGLCEAVIITTSTTMVGDYFHGHVRERWLASQTAVASVSSLLLIAAGGVLGGAFGWRGPFGLYLIALLLAAAVWQFTWEPRDTQKDGEASAAPAMNPARSEQGPVGAAFPLARLAGICAITILSSIMFYTVPTQFGLALNKLGVQAVPTVGLLTAAATLGVPLGTVLFSISTRLAVVAQLAIEFVLIGVGFLLMGKATHPATFVLAAAINQVGCGMILPTLLTWASRGLSFNMRGRGTGMWQSAFVLGQFLSGLVVTLIAELSGGLQPGFLILALANALFVGLALLWATAYGAFAHSPAVAVRPAEDKS